MSEQTQVWTKLLKSLINCHLDDIYFPITNSIMWETYNLDLDLEIITVAYNTQFVVFCCCLLSGLTNNV